MEVVNAQTPQGITEWTERKQKLGCGEGLGAVCDWGEMRDEKFRKDWKHSCPVKILPARIEIVSAIDG